MHRVTTDFCLLAESSVELLGNVRNLCSVPEVDQHATIAPANFSAAAIAQLTLETAEAVKVAANVNQLLWI